MITITITNSLLKELPCVLYILKKANTLKLADDNAREIQLKHTLFTMLPCMMPCMMPPNLENNFLCAFM